MKPCVSDYLEKEDINPVVSPGCPKNLGLRTWPQKVFFFSFPYCTSCIYFYFLYNKQLEKVHEVERKSRDGEDYLVFKLISPHYTFITAIKPSIKPCLHWLSSPLSSFYHIYLSIYLSIYIFINLSNNVVPFYINGWVSKMENVTIYLGL